MVAFGGAVPPIGTVLRTTDLAVLMGKFVTVEPSDGSVEVVVVPWWEIRSGYLGDVVGSCVEIVARETDFVGSFLLCRATYTAWVVMDYKQGYASLDDMDTVDVMRTLVGIGKVFERVGSDVDVVDWLLEHTQLGDVIS